MSLQIRKVPIARPSLDEAEAEAARRAILSGWITQGPEVAAFEAEFAAYVGAPHACAVSNCTTALHLALHCLGVKPGDEVITPSFTYIATVEVVALLRLKPVFVDVDGDTFTMNIDSVKKAITPNTKAIIPVHLYGQGVNMEPLLALAKEHNIAVVEDTAQAIGGTYTFSNGKTMKLGTMGHIGCTSFFPSKNLGAFGDGGAIFTNDDVLADTMKMIANHGQKVRYYHEMVGCNSRLDTMQAAILRIKLRHLDEYCYARRQAADFYDKAFKNNPKITTPYRAPYTYHVFHQYTLQLNGVDRDKVNQQLAERKIPSMIYYPVPCHKQKMLTDLSDDTYDLPVTDKLQNLVISLPMHTELTEEELTFITQNLLEVVG